MNKELQIFNNEEFGSVRMIEVDGKPYAIGSDVAKALGYSLPSRAIIDHCKGYVKHIVFIKTRNRWGEMEKAQEVYIIPEGDIYRLVSKSKLPTAKRFESWVFDEVLPSIRKTGSYSIEQMAVIPAQPAQPISQLDLMQMQLDYLKEVNQRLTVVEDFIESDKIANKRINPEEASFIQAAVKQRAGEIANQFALPYQSIIPKIWGQLKHHFAILEYRDLKKSDYRAAIEFIESWRLKNAAKFIAYCNLK